MGKGLAHAYPSVDKSYRRLDFAVTLSGRCFTKVEVETSSIRTLERSPVEPGNSTTERLNGTLRSGDAGSPERSHVSFGLYEVNLHTHELRKGGLRLRIPLQSFQILAMLLEKPGQVVSREDLRRKLWRSDVFVDFEAGVNVAVQKLRGVLQDTSREPRYIETVPKVGYRFIASVELLNPVSDEVPQSAVTLDSAELPSIDTIPGELLTEPLTQRRRWPYWAAAGLSLALLTAYIGYRYSRNQRVSVAQAQPQHQPSAIVPASVRRRSVAVMGFTNVSGNAQNLWLSTAFTEMLATELAAGDHLRAIAEEHVARAKLELSLTNRDSYADDTLAKIRKDLGCDYVVAGSYLAIGPTGSGRVRLDARVQDALTGDTVASFAVVGSQSDIFDLASRAGEQLRANLGVGTLTSNEAEEVKLALPSNPEAARLYSDGLAELRLYDNAAAVERLERVIRLQPEYSPAYSALATAWFALGHDAKATDALKKALDLAHNLPQPARLETEARYCEMSGDWTQAVEIYSRLQQSYPDNLDYGLELARAQDSLGNSVEAAVTIATLRRSSLLDQDDPRIDLTEATVALHLGDFKRQLALAEIAAGKSERAGARLLLARAKLFEGYAKDDLGDFGGALEAYAVAKKTFEEYGNLDDSAVALMNIGNILLQQGKIAGAKQTLLQALTVFRKNGDLGGLATGLSNLGASYEAEGNLPRAESFYRTSLAMQVKRNLKGKHELIMCNLAMLLQRQGKFGEAKDMLEPLVEHLRTAGKKSLLAYAIQALGSIAEAQGDMPTALRMQQEAASLFKDTGDKKGYAGAERSLGKAFLMEADFVSSNRALSEALSIDHDIGAKTDADVGQVKLAEVSLAQAGSVDLATLHSSINELRQQKMTDDEIEGEIILARETIQEGRTAEAAKMLGQTNVLSAKSYDPTVHFDLALAIAHLRAVQHRFNDARRTIRPALLSSVGMGCVRCQLEARLELGEVEIQAGNIAGGRAQLHELANEAGSRGFRLIAERAAADGR
jgi:DNA-binding winged helix-turn-helix (wHTH) protein/tetratricopeptide (TPR) repeat protein